jgi:hypothetical protein
MQINCVLRGFLEKDCHAQEADVSIGLVPLTDTGQTGIIETSAEMSDVRHEQCRGVIVQLEYYVEGGSRMGRESAPRRLFYLV